MSPTLELEKVTALGASHILATLRAIEPLEFSAGQWINLHLGHSEQRDAKAISFASAPSELPRVELCARRKTGSELVPALEVAAGTRFTFDGPYGAFRWIDGDGPLLIAATSTGIAAIRSIVRERYASSNEPLEGLVLHAIAEDPDVVFAEEVASWCDREPALEGRVLTLTGSESSIDTWEPLLDSMRRWLADHPEPRVLMAGHGGWIKPFRRELRQSFGLDRSRVRAEIFWP